MHVGPHSNVGTTPLRLGTHGITACLSHVATIACNVRPRSRGEVRLASAQHEAPPVVDPNYLAEPEDWTIAVEAPGGRKEAANAVWGYQTPYDEAAPMSDHYAFYKTRVDAIEAL